MEKSNFFNDREILRIQGDTVVDNKQSSELIKVISGNLIEIMQNNDWAGISPQNVILDKGTKNVDNLYKKIIILKDFNGIENFEILNPEYEVLTEDFVFMHEGCGSIETVENNPFMVLNLVPIKIKITGFTPEFEKIEFTLSGYNDEKQEQISYIVHEINHINGKVITDGGIIRRLVEGDPDLHLKLKLLYPELIPTFLDFDGKGYTIHSLGKEGIFKTDKSGRVHHNCSKIAKNKKREDILPFHFDMDYDLDLLKSSINRGGENYKISSCPECF